MGTPNRFGEHDALHDLPFLLKPAPRDNASGRLSSAPARSNPRSTVRPPPPSAGYNPYFDLPPDVDIASSGARKRKEG